MTGIYNPRDLKAGMRVIVDKGKPNSCEVEIIEITPAGIYSVVKADDGYQWTTMTRRLTPIEK